jgi:hypothetical protein
MEFGLSKENSNNLRVCLNLIKIFFVSLSLSKTLFSAVKALRQAQCDRRYNNIF